MTAPDSALVDWTELPVHRPLAGISGSVRTGADLSAALFRLEPGAVVPRHSHVNEEFGHVLSGSLQLEAGAETRLLTVGEGFLIPGDVPHAAVAGPEGCLLLECYSPPRDPFVPQNPGEQA